MWPRTSSLKPLSSVGSSQLRLTYNKAYGIRRLAAVNYSTRFSCCRHARSPGGETGDCYSLWYLGDPKWLADISRARNRRRSHH